MKAPRDPNFPGLGTALDVDSVLELLRSATPECQDRLKLLGCTIVDVRYRPGGPCWILYRLKVKEGTSRSRRQLISARLLGADELPNEPPSELVARYEARNDRVLEKPVVHLPQVPMVLYVFPLDTALPGLFDATDASMMKRHLNRMWGRRKVRVRKVIPRQLGYTPQARAAFMYDVLGECKETGLPELRRLIGKMHAKKGTARLFADAWALWQAGGGRISIAPPVGYIATAGLTLQEQVRGQRLGGMVTAPDFTKRVRQTAGQLATMHGLSVPLTTRRKPTEEAQGVHRWAGVLMAIRPDLARRVERLRDRLAAELEARVRLSGPIHADFHHTNVLVDADDVTIIDFDEMAFGDPMVDVGRFLASLRVPARRAFGDIGALQEAGEAFLDRYLTQAGGDEKRARLFEAASLLIAAGSSFRIQRSSWEEEVSMVVEEAERVFRSAENGSAPATGGSVPRQSLTAEERSRWARDGVYMQALLDPHIRTAYGADVTSCRVVRGSDGASQSIRYELRGWRGKERWSASLRGIARKRGGHDLARRLGALRTALDGSPNAPVLPQPVAYFKSLGLLVWQVPSGTRFSDLLGTGDAVEAATKVAHALAALHRTPLELEKRRHLDRELRTLRERVEKLNEVRPDLATRATALLAEVERRSRAVPAKLAPIVRTVHPHHVLCLDERVALDKVEEVTLSHPFIDVADFLARITLLGIEHGSVEETAEAANRFREAYAINGAPGQDGMATFEASALLRLACTQSKREPQGAAAERLLERAEARLTL